MFENVTFGLRIKKVPEAEIKKKVRQMLATVDLKGYEKRPVSKLSGGQQQRVAIARALVCEPQVLLLDEPLGALDLKLRKDMQLELKNLQQKLQTTFVYVTHDQEEALTMSDTVVVMNNGKIEQIGAPIDIYNEPANAFVADFIGEANILNGLMLEDRLVKIGGAEFPCVDKGFGKNRPVDVVIRPEDVEIVKPQGAKLSGTVTDTVFKGVHYEMSVSVNGCMWLIHNTKSVEPGTEIGIEVVPDNIHIMDKLFATTDNEFDAVVVSSNSEENSMEIEIEGKSVTARGRCYPQDTRLHVVLPPDGVYIAGDGTGDLEGYIESVIWKGEHNEIIVETDAHKWLMSSDFDEQIATYVQLSFRFDKAVFTEIAAEGQVAVQ